MIHLKVSQKAASFMITAVEHEITAIKLKIEDSSVSEDDISDYANDLYYYEIILEELKKQSKE